MKREFIYAILFFFLLTLPTALTLAAEGEASEMAGQMGPEKGVWDTVCRCFKAPLAFIYSGATRKPVADDPGYSNLVFKTSTHFSQNPVNGMMGQIRGVDGYQEKRVGGGVNFQIPNTSLGLGNQISLVEKKMGEESSVKREVQDSALLYGQCFFSGNTQHFDEKGTRIAESNMVGGANSWSLWGGIKGTFYGFFSNKVMDDELESGNSYTGGGVTLQWGPLSTTVEAMHGYKTCPRPPNELNYWIKESIKADLFNPFEGAAFADPL